MDQFAYTSSALANNVLFERTPFLFPAPTNLQFTIGCEINIDASKITDFHSEADRFLLVTVKYFFPYLNVFFEFQIVLFLCIYINS